MKHFILALALISSSAWAADDKSLGEEKPVHEDDEGGALTFVSSGAKTVSSEFFHFPSTDKKELTTTFSHKSVTYNRTGAPDVEFKGNSVKGQYSVGINEYYAAGVVLSYTKIKVDVTGQGSADYVGLDNVNLLMNGNFPMDKGVAQFGATLSLSPKDRETETNGDRNQFTGGHFMTPYIGYEMNFDKCVLGAKLETDINIGDRTEIDESINPKRRKMSGGETSRFTLFYEHNFSETLLAGFRFSWIRMEDIRDLTTDTKTDNITPQQEYGVYVPLKLSGGVLLPELIYSTTSADKVDSVKLDEFTTTGFNIGYRVEM